MVSSLPGRYSPSLPLVSPPPATSACSCATLPPRRARPSGCATPATPLAAAAAASQSSPCCCTSGCCSSCCCCCCGWLPDAGEALQAPCSTTRVATIPLQMANWTSRELGVARAQGAAHSAAARNQGLPALMICCAACPAPIPPPLTPTQPLTAPAELQNAPPAGPSGRSRRAAACAACPPPRQRHRTWTARPSRAW